MEQCFDRRRQHVQRAALVAHASSAPPAADSPSAAWATRSSTAGRAPCSRLSRSARTSARSSPRTEIASVGPVPRRSSSSGRLDCDDLDRRRLEAHQVVDEAEERRLRGVRPPGRDQRSLRCEGLEQALDRPERVDGRPGRARSARSPSIAFAVRSPSGSPPTSEASRCPGSSPSASRSASTTGNQVALLSALGAVADQDGRLVGEPRRELDRQA